MDEIDLLSRLFDLKEKGAISEEEFQAQKKKLLETPLSPHVRALKRATGKPANNGYVVIEAVKTTNTPCLWVSLDYWNLYFSKSGVLAVRCHRGWFGFWLFIIRLFLYLVMFILLGALGIFIDKSNGETKCRLLKDKIDEILLDETKYTIIEASWENIESPQASDLCLGNLWLKYRIIVSGKSFYVEEEKFTQLSDAVDTCKNAHP